MATGPPGCAIGTGGGGTAIVVTFVGDDPSCPGATFVALKTNGDTATGFGAPQGPDLYIGKERFRETFCADVPVDVAEVMFATQRPLSSPARRLTVL